MSAISSPPSFKKTKAFGMVAFEAKKGHRRSSFLIHGFPSDGSKSEDLAQQLTTVGDVFLTHQPGLGESSGVFSFTQSLEALEKYITTRAANYDEVVLVGHSWGGYCAMALAKRLPKARLVLIAPLVLFPQAEDVRGLLTEMARARGYDDSFIAAREREVEGLRVVNIIPSNRDILLVHGELDDVIPFKSSIALASHLSWAKLVIVADDHWFTRDRAKLIKTVSNWVE